MRLFYPVTAFTFYLQIHFYLPSALRAYSACLKVVLIHLKKVNIIKICSYRIFFRRVLQFIIGLYYLNTIVIVVISSHNNCYKGNVVENNRKA